MLNFVNDWKLSRKMLAAFGFVGLLLAAVAISGILTARTLTEVATRHVERGIAGTEALGEIVSDLREYRIIMFTSMTTSDPAAEDALRVRYEKNTADLNASLAAYAKLAGEFEPQFEQLRSDLTALEQVNANIFRSEREKGEAATLDYMRTVGKDASNKAIADATELLRLTKGRSAAANAAGQATASFALTLMFGLSLVAFGVLFALWRLLDRTLAKPMAELSTATSTLAAGGTATVPHRERADELGDVAKAVETFRVAAVTRAEADARAAAEQEVVTRSLGEGLQALSAGDLTAEVKADFPAGYAGLKANFNDALASLRSLIGAVGASTEAIRTGSNEIASASEDLARRTESNAASLEETSAALVQIDGRLKASASASVSTVARADQAIATVGGGRAIAEEAVQAMGRVSDSAKGIDSVIEGLDKIAFQTRVLAMNAAVEAGRAGDAGRGFAVVADLVSALAMRAEEEAKRARDQLTVTQTDIVTAVDAVQRVDGALANISGDVGEVHKLLGGMASDNQAQASAITQITSAIGSMDQATQENAAMVEETSAAARNLTAEVASLAEQASAFKVDDGAPARKPAPIALQPRKPAAYVSPVKALPAKTKGNGKANGAANGHDADNWAAF